MRLRHVQKVWLQMPLFVLLLQARLLFELSKGLLSAAAVIPPPSGVIHESKEGESRPKNQQPLKEQFECGRTAKMSLADEEMEDEEYESDFEENGSDDEGDF